MGGVQKESQCILSEINCSMYRGFWVQFFFCGDRISGIGMGGELLECQVEVLWRGGVGVKGVVHGFRRVLRFLLWNFVFVGGIQKGESTHPVESMWELSARDWGMVGG